jgi:hypothetical protein
MSKSRKHRSSRSGRHHGGKSKRSSYGVKNVASKAEKGIGSVYGAISSVFNLGAKSAKGVSRGVSRGVSKSIRNVSKSKRRRRH